MFLILHIPLLISLVLPYLWSRSLVESGEVQMATNMVENMIYQIDHYGAVLNANRTYYLSRSQPPFLSVMISDVYRVTNDTAWLAKQVPSLEKFYQFWNGGDHAVNVGKDGKENGRDEILSRYYAAGSGPAPEVIHSELDSQVQRYLIWA